MRVAANEVERTLELADLEVAAQRESGSISDSHESIVAAFKRAAEYRDRPLRQVMLPGLKSGMKQPVIMTNIKKNTWPRRGC